MPGVHAPKGPVVAFVVDSWGHTLFPGGPGLTGWPLSDFITIIGSIQHHLFTLPGECAVHPGHGLSTTIGNEQPHLDAWIARGW